MGEPVAYVCRGRDCSRRDEERCALLAALAAVGPVEEVKCQDLCHGPVAAVAVEGRLEWFERVRSGKARASLVQAAAGRLRRPLPKRLKKRRAKKRAGRPPKGRTRPFR